MIVVVFFKECFHVANTLRIMTKTNWHWS